MVSGRNTRKATRRQRTVKATRPRRARVEGPRKARAATPPRKPRAQPAAPPTRSRPASRPAADRGRQLRADRERLGLGRGEDMTVAAADMELRADRQISRDAVHERDLSGS